MNENLQNIVNKEPDKEKLIVITGAGGFIAGALTRYFFEKGFKRIRAVDKKPLPQWYQRLPEVENLCLDLSEKESAIRAVEGAFEVYNLAADMGGMGFIERFRVECLRSILINTHLLEAAYRAGAERYFFSSSACAYNITLQQDPDVRALNESDAYPAMAERGYGWEKLVSEISARNILPNASLKPSLPASIMSRPQRHLGWSREKAPAAICRKVIDAKASEVTRL